MTDVGAVIAQVHRDEWARVVATLTRRFGDLDIAEEMAAEAFATAVERWPTDGVPPNPGAWLTVTADRKAIDRLRRESKRDTKHQAALLLSAPQEPQNLQDPQEPQDAQDAIDDDRLRLVFTCCHPALAEATRVALTLRMVGGLTLPEIARAFLVTETAMGQRITRAKAKIKAAKIPYRVPSQADLPARVAGVLTVLYLIFNEGYLTSDPEKEAVRADLTTEAIRLTRLVHALLPADSETSGLPADGEIPGLPADGEITGLLALMLLTESRRPARVSPAGELIPLPEQDRQTWNQSLIAEGHALVRARLASGQPPGRYQLLAAINAVHTDAPDASATDWSQIIALYDHLLRLDPSPIVRLNRAIALAELQGPAAALTEIDPLPLTTYHAYHATRADLLRRLNRPQDSHAAYTQAIALTTNTAELAYLTRRRAQLPTTP